MALKLSFYIEAIDRATAPIRAINRTLESTTGPVSRLTRSWGNLTGQVRGITTQITLMTGAVAGAFYPLHRMIDEGSKIHDFSKGLKISTTDFQRLAYAINQDGGSIEDAANALMFFQQNAAAAAEDGGGEMAKWFRRAGMEAEFLHANINKVGGVQVMLERFADSIKGLSGPFQVQMSKAMLGKGAGKVLQTMAGGAKGLKAAGDKAESLGIIIAPDDLAKMDQAGDSMQDVWKVLRGLTSLIAIAAIPAIEQISAAIIEWTKANRGLIQAGATEFFERLRKSLPDIVKATIGITAGLGMVFSALNAVADVMGGWDKIIMGFVALKAVLLIGALAQVGIALFAVGAALIASPIGLTLLLLAGLAAWAKIIYDNWEPISKFFTDLWAAIKSAFGDAVNWIVQKIAMLTDLVAGFIGKLNSITPEFIKRFTLPGMALNVAASAVAPGAGAQQTNLGGTLKIEIDQTGRARVAELKREGDALDFEVYLGNVLSP